MVLMCLMLPQSPKILPVPMVMVMVMFSDGDQLNLPQKKTQRCDGDVGEWLSMVRKGCFFGWARKRTSKIP